MSNDDNNTTEHEEQLVKEINSLTTKLGTYQPISEDPKDIACSACPSEKMAYEICMQKWYNGVFLKGNAGLQLPCEPEYEIYNNCVMKHLKSKNLDHLVDFKFKE